MQTYSWSIGSGNQTIVINNFNVTKPMVKELIFKEAGSASNARDSDQLALYPMWHIGVGLDKYYPGNVYGIYVDIWADTGQIRDIYEVFSTYETATVADSSISNYTSKVETTTNSSFTAISTALTPLAFIAMGVSPIWLIRKKTSLHSLRLSKLRKIGSMALCFLIGSVALMALASAVPTVNAACANIWGETSAGYNHLNHTSTEIYVQQQLSGNISSWFGSAGYANHTFESNSQTTKSNVLYYTSYYGQCYPSVETVYFDHGVGMAGGNGLSYPYNNEWHYMLCTDLSTLNVPTEDVFDYQLYSATSTGNYYFSYISTCHSASLYNGNFINTGYTGTYGSNQGGSGNIIGMPYAWTHRLTTSSPTSNPPTGYMSSDGYCMPDSGAYCYIGFVNGSASLCQAVDNRPSGTTTYAPFVYLFFYGLLNLDLTVNDALDYAASQAFPPEAFAGTELYQGFTADWGMGNPYSNCDHMVVYGNGDIYLYAGGPDYVTTPSISGPTSGYTNTAYQFTASATDPYGYYLTYTFNWGDGSSPTTTGLYSSGTPVQVSHSWSTAGPYTISVKAQSQNGVSSSTSYYGVTINNPQPVYHYLTVGAGSAYTACPLYPSVYVDGNYVGTAPLTISVLEGWHTVEVDYWVWNPYLSCYSYFYSLVYDDGYTGYGSGSPVPVYHNQYATAWYIP
jgi:hypothetical protein